MNILVTGSNGFIGHHVCTWLREKGCYVIGVGRNEKSRAVVDEYICCDLNSDKVSTMIDDLACKQIDVMVHMAADMRHEPYEVKVVESNCTGTQRLLELCEMKKIPVFIQLSSLPVIGKPVQHPITEEHPINPPTVYHATKRMQELLANYAYYKHGVRTISYRISSPVGIGMNQKTILPVFIKNAVQNDDLIIYGNGTRKQTYIHVDDISQAIYKAIQSEAQGVYNLSSKNIYSNYELAEKCIEVLHSKSKIIFNKIPDMMDDYVWDVSLKKITEDIGYSPNVTIETAIIELGNYYKSN